MPVFSCLLGLGIYLLLSALLAVGVGRVATAARPGVPDALNHKGRAATRGLCFDWLTCN